MIGVLRYSLHTDKINCTLVRCAPAGTNQIIVGLGGICLPCLPGPSLTHSQNDFNALSYPNILTNLELVKTSRIEISKNGIRGTSGRLTGKRNYLSVSNNRENSVQTDNPNLRVLFFVCLIGEILFFDEIELVT